MATQSDMQNDSEPSTNPLDWYGMYPFSSDETYQQGLESILAGGALSGNPSEDVKEEILRRTRVFYFNKMTRNSITIDEAREYEHSLIRQHSTDIVSLSSSAGPEALGTASSAELTPSGGDSESRVLTFAELKELIESGKVDQIPNNKVIPEALNDAPPSDSVAAARKKPWELSATPTTA